MGQANESPSIFSTLLNPSFVLAVGGLVAYLLSEPALRSQRPDGDPRATVPPPPSPDGMNALHARLWDDPIAVAYQDSRRRRAGTEPEKWVANLLNHFHVGPLRLDASDSPKEMDGTRIQHYFARIVKDGSRLLCLPVLVPGEPYDYDAEQRQRTTYAVLSALANQRYDAASADRLTYIEVPIEICSRSLHKSVTVPLVVPVKLFTRTKNDHSPSDAYDTVLVCWINEDQLGERPLAAIAQVLEGMFGKVTATVRKRKIHLRIIGPNDSDTLLDMAEENATWNLSRTKALTGDAFPVRYSRTIRPGYFQRSFANQDLYSSQATLDERSLRDPEVKKHFHQFTNDESRLTALRVVRTIGTDFQLAAAISHELCLRGAWSKRCESEPRKQYVVLVTEQDTRYGRAIEVAFRHALLGDDVTAQRDKKGDEILQVFKYLRGLDGETPGSRKKRETDVPNPTGATKSEEGSFLRLDSARTRADDAEPPTGRHQLDYLRRLEQRLLDFQEEKRAAGAEGITAIGVVGTDIYDKLLILRALRKQFPKATFFATDLDAALALKSEYPTARNLVVASHYGLRLNPRLQRHTPPFRDSYQTATYFSTLLALGDSELVRGGGWPNAYSSDPWGLTPNYACESGKLRPLVFEIGRHGPYQLTKPEEETASAPIQPESSRERHWLTDHVAVLVWIGVIFGFVACLVPKWTGPALRSLNPWDFEHAKGLGRGATSTVIGTTVVVLTLVAMCHWIVLHDHLREDGEPFVLLEGISIWPTTLIRFVALAMAVILAIKSSCDIPDLGSPGRLKVLLVLVSAAILYAGSFFVVAWLVYSTGVLEPPALPYRGCTSHCASSAALYLAVFGQLALTFFVAGILLKCRRWLRKIIETPSSRLPCDEPMQIKKLSEVTKIVGRSVKYPLLVIVLMVASRHPAFDLFDWSWPLAGIWTFLAFVVIANWYSLRGAASEARRKALERLRNARLAVLSKTDHDPKVAQIDQCISEVEAEDDGAFAPWTQDPLFRAIGYFAGGIGGIQLLEQLLPYT